MLEWISHRLLAIVNFVPALFVDKGSANFELVRAMYGLILIVLILYVFANLRPLCSIISGYLSRASYGTWRKQ